MLDKSLQYYRLKLKRDNLSIKIIKFIDSFLPCWPYTVSFTSISLSILSIYIFPIYIFFWFIVKLDANNVNMLVYLRENSVKQYNMENYRVRQMQFIISSHLLLLSRLSKIDTYIDKFCIVYLCSENSRFLNRPNNMNHLSNSAGLWCKTKENHLKPEHA